MSRMRLYRTEEQLKDLQHKLEDLERAYKNQSDFCRGVKQALDTQRIKLSYIQRDNLPAEVLKSLTYFDDNLGRISNVLADYAKRGTSKIFREL